MYINLVNEFLLNSATKLPEKTALSFGGRRYTYRELYDSSSSLAAFLAGEGLKRGDRVITYLGNSPETVISIFGALMAGGVFSVVNETIKAGKFRYIVDNCAPSFIVTDPSKLPRLQNVPHDLSLIHI